MSTHAQAVPTAHPPSGALRWTLTAAAGAALLYGGWGFVANYPFGVAQAARAAAVQGAWSFALTLVLGGVVELSVRLCTSLRTPIAVAAIPPLLLAWLGPIVVHGLNGTPALARTVAPGVVIGSLYVLAQVSRSRRARGAAGPRLRRELIDLRAVRRRGSAAEKEAVAQRIFSLWQPIFSHLDDKDASFHLRRHVEDQSAVQIRALFGVDAEGRDRALMIARVHAHEIDGRVWARLTINAGHDPGYVQSRFGQVFIAYEIWRYRLLHPFRPFFIVDSVVSAASYCVYAKVFSGFVPTASRPIPQRWWPLAEAGASALGGEPVPGARREVRRFVATVRDTRARVDVSDRSARAARFYDELTGGVQGVGLVVMAPLSFFRYTLTSVGFISGMVRRSIWGHRKRVR